MTAKCPRCNRDRYQNELMHNEQLGKAICGDCRREIEAMALTHGEIQANKRERARATAWTDWKVA